MTKGIVIAHYNENLNWVERINPEYKIFIYSKKDTKYNFISANKGHEATCYLKYIIDNYSNLCDKNLFLHGHEKSEHQDHTGDFIANNLNWNLADYFSVNKRNWYFYNGLSETNYPELNGPYMFGFIKKYWKTLFQDVLQLPKTLHHYTCAQFQVDKKLILNKPLLFYKNAYNWLINTNEPCFYSARIFEHTWHYIFTGNPIEEQQKTIFL